MKKLMAIARREWLAYFFSPLGYIVLAAFWFINGFIFTNILGFLSQPGGRSMGVLSILFDNTFFWFFLLFFVPVITMRLISEERKSGSIESLLTAPVSEGTIVLAKFLAAFAFYAILWLPMLAYAAILKKAANFDIRVLASSLLAVMLIGAYLLAIGTFASALSKNQIIAAIIAFVIIMVVFAMGLMQSLANDPAWKDVLGYVTMWDHMDEFARGIVDTRRVVYYLSGTAFFLFLATASLEVKKGQ